jgi:DNA-binding CsgD family transcriptional regulator
VVLEERIALGDPECGVVVWLGGHGPAGAHRFVQPGSVNSRDADLVDACRAAIPGEDFLYPEAVAAFMRDFLRRGQSPGGAARDPLTAREREIVKLIAESRTAREIAHELVISEKTVERHRSNILLKLGLRDRVALTRYAIRHGLVDACQPPDTPEKVHVYLDGARSPLSHGRRVRPAPGRAVASLPEVRA